MRYGFLTFAIIVTVGTYLLPADGADLRIPLPKPRPAVTAPVLPLVPKVAEECLRQGAEPKAGQTLQPDETCPTKLRWRNPK